MAKKEKRISINKLESTMTSPVVSVPMKGVDGVDIIIRRTLPLNDVLQFVANVVSSCIDEETGTYTPEVVPFAIKANVLTYYANFSLPSNVEKQYDLIYNTTAVKQVMDHINMIQYEEIVDAIDEKIAYVCSMMTTAAVQQVNAIAQRMEDFANKSEELFSNVTGEDMANLMRNLSSVGKVDERSLVRAVFDAQNESGTGVDEPEVESAPEKILAFPHTENEVEE